MQHFQHGLRLALTAVLITLAMMTTVRADPGRQSLAATQSAIRDIRDHLWQGVRLASMEKAQVPVAPREAR
jgi:hypothetical protein